jgi:hypothetical protein
MKKLATLLTLMAGVGFALGQGTQVTFQNSVLLAGDHKIYFDTVGNQPGVVGTNYSAELFYVDPTTSALTPWAASISKFRATSTSSPGTWSGKTVTVPPGALGTTLQLEVVVWDTVLNPTQDLVSGAGKFGTSGLFTYTWHDNSPNPQGPADSQMVNMPAFAVMPVPEPSAIALSIIGVAGLLFLRRRK